MKMGQPQPFVSISDRIDLLMKDGVARTAAQIATKLDERRKYVRDLMTLCVGAGTCHISGHEGRTRIYKYGPGPNAELPDTVRPTSAEYSRMYRRQKRLAREAAGMLKKTAKADGRTVKAKRVSERELDEKFRSDGAWWPRGDALVAAAIQSMARIGR